MIFFLAGTSDARELAVTLQQEGYPLIASVVTENAVKELEQVAVPAFAGRMDAEAMQAFVLEKEAAAIVDASHPFAEEASKNAMEAAERAGVPYIRFERKEQNFQESPLITYVSTYEEAADRAAKTKGTVMLTTGSKTLAIFTEKLLPIEDIRLVCRMLPRKDNMEKCEQLGLPQKNIVAIQGPFTKAFDQALYEQYNVTCMVTKASGQRGSVDQKIEAAKELGIETIVIERPAIDYKNRCSSFEEVRDMLSALEIKGGERVGF
ncbi:precorrin-6x reductase [Bacillus sp. FJAT-27231]|uniref:precorrin-6A reductase n=1 Tax=Bacillus sp. FJAT-27231 TaxID=1679168 RepID=UPI0006715261|nr:precorrin-6A reductase [Bacillus sp. FJAT-27231]KMY54321.1 precorrin-6x reductase [Bacillus sp. FJAT-27231]